MANKNDELGESKPDNVWIKRDRNLYWDVKSSIWLSSSNEETLTISVRRCGFLAGSFVDLDFVSPPLPRISFPKGGGECEVTLIVRRRSPEDIPQRDEYVFCITSSRGSVMFSNPFRIFNQGDSKSERPHLTSSQQDPQERIVSSCVEEPKFEQLIEQDLENEPIDEYRLLRCRSWEQVLKTFPVAKYGEKMKGYMFSVLSARKRASEICHKFLDTYAPVPLDEVFDEYTPLMHFVTANDQEMCERLVNLGASVDFKTISGITALHCCVFSGSLDLFKFLVSRSKDINIQDENGETPLYCALQCPRAYEERLEFSRVLLQRGASVNVKTKHQIHPLHLAAGCLDLTKLLIDHLKMEEKDAINTVDFSGRTPLMWALDFRCYDVIELLIRENAKTEIRNHQNKTFRDLALQRKDERGLSLLPTMKTRSDVRDEFGLTDHTIAREGDATMDLETVIMFERIDTLTSSTHIGKDVHGLSLPPTMETRSDIRDEFRLIDHTITSEDDMTWYEPVLGTHIGNDMHGISLLPLPTMKTRFDVRDEFELTDNTVAGEGESEDGGDMETLR